TLVLGLGAGDAARNDLAGFGNVGLQGVEIFVIDLLDAFSGETAELTTTEETCHVIGSSILFRDYSSALSRLSSPSADSFSLASGRSRRSRRSLRLSSAFSISDWPVTASSRRITRLRMTASL